MEHATPSRGPTSLGPSNSDPAHEASIQQETINSQMALQTCNMIFFARLWVWHEWNMKFGEDFLMGLEGIFPSISLILSTIFFVVLRFLTFDGAGTTPIPIK